MILAPVIALDSTAAQEEHFRKACGVARLAYNWALAQWKRKYEAGERPSACSINDVHVSQTESAGQSEMLAQELARSSREAVIIGAGPAGCRMGALVRSCGYRP